MLQRTAAPRTRPSSPRSQPSSHQYLRSPFLLILHPYFPGSLFFSLLPLFFAVGLLLYSSGFCLARLLFSFNSMLSPLN